MEVRVLGPVELVDGSKVVPLGPKERLVLAVLAARAGKVVAVDEVAEALWGDSLPKRPDKTVQNHVLRLRKALGPPTQTGGLNVATRPPGYVLETAEQTFDVAWVERAVAIARDASARGDDSGAAVLLADASARWRGRAYGELADLPFAQAEAARLDELGLAIAEDRVEVELRLGRERECVKELEVLLASHPLRQRLWAQLMLALYRCGRHADALRAFQRLRNQLVEELGVEPSQELRDLEHAILEQNPLLDRVVGEGPSASVTGRRRVPEPLTRDVNALIGRVTELDRLRQAWKEVAAGTGARVVLIRGEPGIGKTRLVAELARGVAQDEGLVLYGRCDPDVDVADQPVSVALRDHLLTAGIDELAELSTRALGELTRMVPELADRRPGLPLPPQGAPGERQRLLEAASTIVAELGHRRGALVVLDDVQWAESSGVELLRHFVLASRPPRSLVVIVVRNQGWNHESLLGRLLADLRSSSNLDLELSGLDETALAALVEDLSGTSVEVAAPELARSLWDRTRGNPFYSRELLLHLSRHPIAAPLSEAGWEKLGLPSVIGEVVRRRVDQLPGAAQRVLALAAVAGSDCDLAVLEHACAPEIVGDDLVDAVDEGVKAGLLAEASGERPTLAFTHDIVRQAVYDMIGVARRPRMHLRMGEALRAIPGGGVRFHAELAHHFTLAARATADASITALAVQSCREAARDGQTAMAWDLAISQLVTALELLGERPSGERADVLEELGGVLMTSGQDLLTGRKHLDEALAIREGLRDVRGAVRIHARLGEAHSRFLPLLDVRKAFRHYRAATALGGPDDGPEAAALLAGLAMSALLALESADALDASAKAMSIAERFDDESTWATSAAIHGNVLSAQARVAEGFGLIERAWSVADERDDLPLAFQASWFLSFWTGDVLRDPRDAQRWLRRELERPRHQNASYVRPRLIGLLATHCADAGDLGPARTSAPELAGDPQMADWTGLVAFWTGDWDRADEAWHQAAEMAGATGSALTKVLADLRLARLAWARDDLPEAAGRFEDVRARMEAAGGRTLLPGLGADCASAAAASGDLAASHEHIRACRELLALAMDWRGVTGVAERAEGDVLAASGRSDEAVDCYSRSVEIFDRYSVPWERAETLVRWSRALRAAGDAAGASARSAEAVADYERVGAGDVWIERALL